MVRGEIRFKKEAPYQKEKKKKKGKKEEEEQDIKIQKEQFKLH